jgi:hypothetical protein
LTGRRKRYRIVDQDRLLALTNFSSMSEFAAYHADRVSERLAVGCFVREPCWTEAVAVGDEAFIVAAEHSTTYRQSLERYEVEDATGAKAWAVREAPSPYGADSEAKPAV